MAIKKYEINPAWVEYVRRLVDQAPPLSPAQIGRLAILLQVSPKFAPERTERLREISRQAG
jgi:hypothetical protein